MFKNRYSDSRSLKLDYVTDTIVKKKRAISIAVGLLGEI